MFNCFYNPISWMAVAALVIVGMLVFAALRSRTNPHQAKKWRIYAKRTLLFAGFWLLFCCTPLFAMFLSLDVEERFPEWKMEQIPEAAAILLPSDILTESSGEVERKVEQLLAAKKSERVSCLARTSNADAPLKKADLPPEVVVPLTSLDCATTNKLLLVSSVWAIEKDYRECKKTFANAVIWPVAYGHIIGNRTCNEMSFSDFLPSPRGAKLVAQTLKKLLAS